MDLTLSDEQRLLRESVDRFIAETYDADHRRGMAGDPLCWAVAPTLQASDRNALSRHGRA